MACRSLVFIVIGAASSIAVSLYLKQIFHPQLVPRHITNHALVIIQLVAVLNPVFLEVEVIVGVHLLRIPSFFPQETFPESYRTLP